MSRVLVLVCGLLAVRSATAEVTVVRPDAADGPLDNPLKGWCPYTDAGKIRQPYSMVFQYIPWRDLEPAAGEYDFEAVEKSWEVEPARGRHIIFRVYIDHPKLPSGLPDWLREAGVKETRYTEHGGGRSPDYDDPRMLRAMERLIVALGERYNTHPRIAFIEVGLLGFWGEWHTWPLGDLYASPETERRVLDAFRKAFPDKSLMTRKAVRSAGEQDWIGFHDDMFPEDTDNGEPWSFLGRIRQANRADNWRVAVIGGEMVPGKAKQWLGADFETTTTMLDRSHFTWVGPYCPALDRSEDEQFLERSQELVRRMGYEFRIAEVTHPAEVPSGESARLTLAGVNQGVAPFYYPWSVEWALLNTSGEVVRLLPTDWDLREWAPGEFAEQGEFALDVPSGQYQLGFGIRDPWQDRPAIRFANDLPVVDGWTIVSKITVTP